MVKLIDSSTKYLSNQIKRDIKAFILVIIIYTPIIFLIYDNNLNKNISQKSIDIKLNIFKEIIKEEIISDTSPLEEDELYDLDEIMSSEPIEDIKDIEPVEPIKKVLTTKPKEIVQKKKKVYKKKRITKKSVKKNIIKRRVTKSKHHKKIKKKIITKVNNNKFIGLLKRKINQNKIYPRVAKKRGLTGKVLVKFIINKRGRVSNISLSGSKLFFKSTKNAINNSFPINTKGVKLPITINLSLLYKLR